MNVNVEFLIVTYFVSLFVDWVFQTSHQAYNKSKWSHNDNHKISMNALLSHAVTYAILTTLVLYFLLRLTVSKTFIVFIVLFITHAIIDTRIPVKMIMRLKGMTEEQINDVVNFGFMHIGIDHRLHELVILILSLFV